MNDVYILGGLRSYIGIKNGIYKNMLPEELASELLKKLINRYSISNIDEVICGNIIGTGGNITRLMCLKAGLSKVPAFTIDMQCASSMEAINIASLKIKAEDADVIIAGGFESSSMEPLRYYNKNDFRYAKDGRYTQAQFCVEDYSNEASFNFAERICKIKGINSELLNYYTLESHKKAQKASKGGYLNSIIESINGSTKDEGIRKNMSMHLLERLPKLKKEGINSIGNISSLNDGAAFIVLCSSKYIKENKIKPIAKIVSYDKTCVEPLLSPYGAIYSAENNLKKNKMTFNDISAIEFNEAFAVIDVLFAEKYKEFLDKYNIFGGALSYGHPYGASGAINILHLIKALEVKKGDYGISSIAASGGIGASFIIKYLKE